MALRIPENAKGFTYVQTSEPSNPVRGDTWYNPSNGQIKLYNGSFWFVIGDI